MRRPDLIERGRVTAETKGPLAFPVLIDPNVVVPPQFSKVSEIN